LQDRYKTIYLQVELSQTNDNLTKISILDVTDIIIKQQRECDKMYLEAIELNYSHEQMTPLNSIIANSNIAFKRFVEISD